MNNEYCQTSNCYSGCYNNNRYSNQNCLCTYPINNQCNPQQRPQPCCPTTITVGTTTTGAPGTSASVTNSGTATNAILNFVIPRGEAGATNISVGSTTTLPAGSQATVTNSGTDENVVLNFGIPAGPAGANGQNGRSATVTVGSTTTGAPGTNASVTNSGTATDAILNFVIPRGATGATGATGPQGPAGEDGEDGAAATITVGTTTTSDAGTDAIVTNSGTENAAILNFVIPRGETGATGPQGPAGEDGDAATITIGTTTTGEPGTEASVTNVGTDTAAILNFVIPAGESGTITPGVAVAPLNATATLDEVIATVNALITSLTNAGFLA